MEWFAVVDDQSAYKAGLDSMLPYARWEKPNLGPLSVISENIPVRSHDQAGGDDRRLLDAPKQVRMSGEGSNNFAYVVNFETILSLAGRSAVCQAPLRHVRPPAVDVGLRIGQFQRKSTTYAKTLKVVRDDMKFLNAEDKRWMLSETVESLALSGGASSLPPL
jgi:hypothetical protein